MKHTKNTILLIVTMLGMVSCASPAIANPNPTVTFPIKPTETPIVQNEDEVELSDAEIEAGFQMNLPNDLPEDYKLKDITYMSEQQALTAFYVWDDPRNTGELLFITQQPIEPEANWDTEADIEIEQVGEYEVTIVSGDWWEEEWQKDAPVVRLRWETGGYFYTILYLHNESFSPGYLHQDSLIELVEQM
jgi:hypothetical protein